MELYMFRRIVHYSSRDMAATIGNKEVKLSQLILPGILMLKCIIDRRQM